MTASLSPTSPSASAPRAGWLEPWLAGLPAAAGPLEAVQTLSLIHI